MAMTVESLAAMSGVIASAAYFPEAFKLYKYKSAHDISLITFAVWFVYSIIWLAYGFHINQQPIIITYSIAVTGVSLVFGLSLLYDRRESNDAAKPGKSK